MKVNLFCLLLLCIFLGCKQETPMESSSINTSHPNLVGDFDNFLQVWKENTDDDLHRTDIEEKHQHYHLKFKPSKKDTNNINVSIYKGRNNDELVDEEQWKMNKKENGDIELLIDNEENYSLNLTKDGFVSSTKKIELKGDTLLLQGLKYFENKNKIPYKLIRCRYFSGWIQYPIPSISDSTYFQRDLMLHDQGGMVELDIENVDYTFELTQLVYGHQIKLMKLAAYDLSLKDVGINSKSISYTWTSPEATRLGINLRKIVSGWTLIEPGFINSNTMKK